ncbi:MAG TPA: glycosyltransferase family 39 protein [Ktedonobacteraceae bacterium]|nr:glycosyltransferase family 39 protein [Ktedonobacteraceae bacterium]
MLREVLYQLSHRNGYQGDREGRPYPTQATRQTRNMVGATLAVALDNSHRHRLQHTLRVWLTTWELYPVLLLAGFLRLYRLDITEFDQDQAIVFRMARDAVMHGLLPATSNIASIRINNPPGVIYLLMLPAFFSSNPLGGALLIALLNILAVLLTYIFVRRYFGRLAAVLAASLYATASTPLHFSRFIWQQNMIAPFVVLFFIVLYRGVVDRRKGWLFPAVFLLGFVIQLHESTVLLAIPLVLALILAPETLRWRDLAFGLLAVLLIYFPYLLWEFSINFNDLFILLRLSKLPSHIDSVAISYYINFFSPYSQVPGNPHTLVYQLYPILSWLSRFMLWLVIAGFITALVLFLRSFITNPLTAARAGETNATEPVFWSRIWNWWTNFRSSPQRCSMLLLLAWQIVPLLYLSRHSLPIFPYYLLLLMPAPFILIGLFIERLSLWMRQYGRRWNIPRYALYVFICLVLLAQTVGTTAGLIDEAVQNNRHGLGYNSLGFMQNALTEADHLAQRRHLNHVYISSNTYTQEALRYLAEQMSTPTTVFDASSSLVLPNPADGPAVYLVGPDDTLALSLLNQFASVTLVDRPPRLGSDPYNLMIVQPAAPVSASASNQKFANNLQLLDTQPRFINIGSTTLLATRWTFLRAIPLFYRTTYTYSITAALQTGSSWSRYSDCIFTSIRAGDQLIVIFPLPATAHASTRFNLSARYYVTGPHNVAFGPLQLENIRDRRSIPITLQTPGGSNILILM